jgi:acyl-coenzyme A synthetase/AMP-(fatty) acid ligase
VARQSAMRTWRARLMAVPLDANFGALSDLAAARGSTALITLGEPLDIAPAIGQRFDHGEIALVIDAVACRLRQKGVHAGSRVAVIKGNNFDVIILAAALMRLGAIPALLSPRLDEHVLDILLDRLGATLALVDGGVNLAPKPGCPVIQVGEGAGPLITTSDLGETGSPPVDMPSNGLAVITHTSGTTGTPKLVGHSSRSLLAQGGMQVPIGRLLLRGGDVLAACLPWAHTRALAAYVGAAQLGRSFLAISDPDPEHVSQLLADHRPAYLETVPDNFQRWEALAGHHREPFSSVRVFFSTFDASHPRTVRCLLNSSKRRLPVYVQVYAQSETAGVTTKFYTRGMAKRQRVVTRNVGRPVWPFVRMRVVDPVTGRRCRAGRPGTIQVQSEGLFLTYVGDDELAEARRSGPWWDMTDRGYMSRSGSLYFLDRDVDVVAEVESTLALEDQLLDLLPSCEDVVVLPNAKGELVGVISLRPGATVTPEQWQSATRELQLAAVPLVVDRDRIPRTMTGKVRRSELRRELEQGSLPSAM